jgi:hypothetical protein
MNMQDTQLATSSGYESNTEGEDNKQDLIKMKRKSKPKITKKILADYEVFARKISDVIIPLTQLLLAVSSDDETADVSIQLKDYNPIQQKRQFQEDNSNLKHEITQLIIHIYTNICANNIQFLNISNYEKHVSKSLYKDKGYVHSSVKHLILCLIDFIKVVLIN